MIAATVIAVSSGVTLAAPAVTSQQPPHPTPSVKSASDTIRTWNKAFPTAAAPSNVHFIAHYFDDRGTRHQIEAWRSGHNFLHRRTDGRIDLYAVAEQPGGEVHYRMVDQHRKIVADVSRTNLYRIGVYSDMFGLAHVLDTPKEPYHLENIGRDGAPKDIKAKGCQWHALVRTQSKPTRSLVCWSAAWGLPIVIVDADAALKEVFRTDRVEKIDSKQAIKTLHALPPTPEGYALVNVNEEIDPSAD
ncbi:MAG: hypothetical protein ACYCTY_16510 [Sulfuricella sp.]